MAQQVRLTGRRSAGPAQIVLLIAEPIVARLAELTLRQSPYEVRFVANQSEARAAKAERTPQLWILDIDAEQGRVIEFIGQNQQNGRTPVIALTRRADLKRQLEAFERGADDCIGIPFNPAELVARIHAVLRRTYAAATPEYRPLDLGPLTVDLVSRNAHVHGLKIHLTAVEQALLYLLAAHAGTVLSRDTILDTVWGDDYMAGSNIVDHHIRALRSKLQNDWREPTFIETVPGVGYRFKGSAT